MATSTRKSSGTSLLLMIPLFALGLLCVLSPYIAVNNQMKRDRQLAADYLSSQEQQQQQLLRKETSNDNSNNERKTTSSSEAESSETIEEANTNESIETQPIVVEAKNNSAIQAASSSRSSDLKLPRVLAFVFPQFHQEPLNDKFWGEGFTDWNNLRAAPQKNRNGWDIPRPTELGYYDLTDTTTRRKQGELAREYKVDGFAFHHYWFYDDSHPGPNLHAPLVEMLKDGHPDIPFCLHWAATKWMNTWHGKTKEGYDMPKNGVMQPQRFPEQYDDPRITEHYDWLKQFFHHPNYIKVDGQPVFMLYQKKPSAYPVLKRLRELAIQDGFPGLYFTLGLNRPHKHLQYLDNLKEYEYHLVKRTNFKIFNKTIAYPNTHKWMDKGLSVPDWCAKGETAADKPTREIPGIVSSFDNTPRRNYEEAVIFSNDTPEKVLEFFRNNFYSALYYETCCFSGTKYAQSDDRFIMINAWNEWAEGMELEPSDVYGRRFLEIVRDTKQQILDDGCTYHAPTPTNIAVTF